MKKHLTKHFNTKVTPQTEAIPGSNQVPNNAGGYSYEVSDWIKLDRFLILGTEGGSYYVSENKLTKDNCKTLMKCIKEDGKRVVDRIIEISAEGRAPKNDYALYAYAMASTHGNEEVRRYALDNLYKVARIGTHLFHFIEYRESFGGWNRSLRRSVSNWYLNKDVDKLAYQLIKYRQRDGWSHRDLLRLAHPHPTNKKIENLFKWVVGKSYDRDVLPSYIEGFLQIQEVTTPKAAASLIRKYDLPREVVPTDLLNEKLVWEALMEKMPMTAMIRNLANMTRIGLLDNFSEYTNMVVDKLNEKELKDARVHPIQLISALLTYKKGMSDRDSNKSWTPVSKIVDALDDAFYLSFKTIEPSGKNLNLALDVSGSMEWPEIVGVPGLTPRIATAVLAMVSAKVEKNSVITAFGNRYVEVDISRKKTLDSVVQSISSLGMMGTDCSLPITHATAHKWKVDVFSVYTDSETYAGRMHPTQALEQYKQKMGIDAKLIVVGMVANHVSIADPKNPRMLDVVGFDINTPAVISEFSRS